MDLNMSIPVSLPLRHGFCSTSLLRNKFKCMFCFNQITKMVGLDLFTCEPKILPLHQGLPQETQVQYIHI